MTHTTKQQLYLELCREAGTYDSSLDADAWYEACSHNIHPALDASLASAAAGDAAALAEARHDCGLPALA